MTVDRVVVVGDPQTTFEQFIAVLRARDVLTVNDVVRPSIRLVSIGDHFDFGREGIDSQAAARAGIEIMNWLRGHPKSQVRILVGNHDICRVMEFASLTDADFALARKIAEAKDEEALFARFPSLPSTGVVLRDFSAFCEAQRELIQECLLTDRLSLAEVGQTSDGRDVLITHAGVTDRELGILGCQGTGALETADALNDALRLAVDRVACAWRAGRVAALDLGPLHRPGSAGNEGGGLLYHRPSTVDEHRGVGEVSVPRRFHPSSLPRGLHQVCGHTQHKKCTSLLPEVAAHARVPDGALRTLKSGNEGLSYEAGCITPGPDEGCLWMVDSGLNRWPAAQVQVLELASLVLNPPL